MISLSHSLRDEGRGVMIMTSVPRTSMTWLTGRAWNNFGGGDAGNSGGSNVIFHDKPYDAADVVGLRNHSITPPTESYDMWVKALEESGYKHVFPQPRVMLDDKDLVSRPSTPRTDDGRERLLLANALRYGDNYNIRYTHARVMSVIRDESGRAIGIRIRGVRMDNDQKEYGGCVSWKATKAVVLAGGVFNTFDF